MSTPSAILSVHNLSCIRQQRILFEGLNLNVYPGDIVQIDGANGAGKSSLLRILAGLSQPFEGHVEFKQSKITEDRENYLQNLLYLGHLAGVKNEMTAQENLEFNLSLHGLDASQAEDTLAKVNLLGFEDSPAAHLSAGQHRRISLARLWQSSAPIWILDEPFTAIDKQGVDKLEQKFLDHCNQGGCVIFTSHQDMMLATNLKKITLEYRLF